MWAIRYSQHSIIPSTHISFWLLSWPVSCDFRNSKICWLVVVVSVWFYLAEIAYCLTTTIDSSFQASMSKSAFCMMLSSFQPTLPINSSLLGATLCLPRTNHINFEVRWPFSLIRSYCPSDLELSVPDAPCRSSASRRRPSFFYLPLLTFISFPQDFFEASHSQSS